MIKSEQTFGQPNIIWSHLYLETKNKTKQNNLKLINREWVGGRQRQGLGNKQMGKERGVKMF